MHSTANKPAPMVRKRSEQFPSEQNMWIGLVGLLSLTLLIFIPSYRAQFIWDDNVIAEHPLLKQGWSGLRDIWFTIKFGDFCPVTATTFWIEWQIHGAMKEIQHATNVVLQALNVVLLWRVLLRLKIPGAWLIAAAFAVHPVCVASVTWLAERKNTLSMVFYWLCLLFYLRAEDTAKEKTTSHFRQATYWLSFVFYLLALLSKSSVVVLPVVILLFNWWRDRRIDRQNILPVLPFFIFAFASGVMALIGHHYFAPKIGIEMPKDPPLERILAAGRAVWFYLGKDLLPIHLTLHYPKWKIDPTSPPAYLPGLAIPVVLGLFWKFRKTWGRVCLFGFGYFLIAVGPTLGVLNMVFLMIAQVADHLQYLALPGVIALVIGGGLYLLQKKFPRNAKSLPLIVFVLIVIPLAVLSWKHQRLMANAEALWRDNIEKNPNSHIAYNNLGGILFERNQFSEAAETYQKAVNADGKFSFVHVNLGRALFSLGKTEEAISQYKDAIQIDKTDFKAFNNMAVALITLGRTNEAIASFQKAVEYAPTDATYFFNLIRLLMESGRTKEVIQLYRKRLEVAPGDVVVHQKIGELLFGQNQLDEALKHFRQAVRLQPDFVEARFGLAEILARQNKKPEAVEQWRQILKRKPDAVQVLANLSWALATDRNDKVRNGKEAVVFAEQLCVIAGRNSPAYVDLLAAAYAEAGRFADAISTEEDAISLASSSGQKELAATYRLRLNGYRKGQPFRSQ
jgi:tetratricopeptide (TPR) repeat protein